MEKFTGKTAIGDDENKSQTSITQTSLTQKSAIKNQFKGELAKAIQKKAQEEHGSQLLSKDVKDKLNQKLSVKTAHQSSFDIEKNLKKHISFDPNSAGLPDRERDPEAGDDIGEEAKSKLQDITSLLEGKGSFDYPEGRDGEPRVLDLAKLNKKKSRTHMEEE